MNEQTNENLTLNLEMSSFQMSEVWKKQKAFKDFLDLLTRFNVYHCVKLVNSVKSCDPGYIKQQETRDNQKYEIYKYEGFNKNNKGIERLFLAISNKKLWMYVNLPSLNDILYDIFSDIIYQINKTMNISRQTYNYVTVVNDIISIYESAMKLQDFLYRNGLKLLNNIEYEDICEFYKLTNLDKYQDLIENDLKNEIKINQENDNKWIFICDFNYSKYVKEIRLKNIDSLAIENKLVDMDLYNRTKKYKKVDYIVNGRYTKDYIDLFTKIIENKVNKVVKYIVLIKYGLLSSQSLLDIYEDFVIRNISFV